MGRASNPLVSRMRWVAKKYPDWVTMVTMHAWTEATGAHDLWDQIRRIHSHGPEPMLRLVERLDTLTKDWNVATTTRFDRYLPWAAKTVYAGYLPYFRLAQKYGLPEEPSRWLPGTGEVPRGLTPGEDAIHAMRTAEAVVSRFRAIVDWADAENIDLIRYDLDGAIEGAERWGNRDRPATRGEVLYEFSDGWTVQELTTKVQLESEGKAMQHCVDEYDPAGIPETYRLFSLRAPNDAPHATLEWHAGGNYAESLKGKQNVTPKIEYLRRMAEFRCVAQHLIVPEEQIGSVRRAAVAQWPDHVDGFSRKLLGVFVIHGTLMRVGEWGAEIGEKGERVAIYEGGLIVDADDIDDYVAGTERAVVQYLHDTGGHLDPTSVRTSLINYLDTQDPADVLTEIRMLQYPGWVDWPLWRMGIPVEGEDEMVRSLTRAKIGPNDIPACVRETKERLLRW